MVFGQHRWCHGLLVSKFLRKFAHSVATKRPRFQIENGHKTHFDLMKQAFAACCLNFNRTVVVSVPIFPATRRCPARQDMRPSPLCPLPGTRSRRIASGQSGMGVPPMSPMGIPVRGPKGLPMLDGMSRGCLTRKNLRFSTVAKPCLGQARQPGACRHIAVNPRALLNHHSRFSRQFPRDTGPDWSAPVHALGNDVLPCPFVLYCDVTSMANAHPFYVLQNVSSKPTPRLSIKNV